MWVEFVVGSLPCSKRFFFDLELPNVLWVNKSQFNFFFLQTLMPTTQSTLQTCPHYNGHNSKSYGLIGTKYSIAVLDAMFAVAKEKGLRIQVEQDSNP